VEEKDLAGDLEDQKAVPHPLDAPKDQIYMNLGCGRAPVAQRATERRERALEYIVKTTEKRVVFR
jgi:hypothetical protein